MRNVNFSNNIAKIVRKSKRDEIEIMWLKGDIKKVILAMILSKYLQVYNWPNQNTNWPERNRRREEREKDWIVASIATHQAKFWIIVIVLIK